MKFSLCLLLLPAMASAFAPQPHLSRPSSAVILKNAVTDVTDDVLSKTEELIGKGDKVVMKRAMRIVDHAPILYTLRMLAEKAGDASKFGINMAPVAPVASPLAIPGWSAYIWSIIAICQLAAVAKSALADDSNDLSQADISTLAVSNLAAAKAIGSGGNPLAYTAALALVSGYGARQGNASGDVTLQNAAIQLMSSFATVLTVMGGVSALAARIGLLDGRTEIVRTVAVAAYYLLAVRKDNTTVKKAVNAGIIGGYMWARMAASGIAFSTSSLLSVSLVGAAYVTFISVMQVKNAVMDTAEE